MSCVFSGLVEPVLIKKKEAEDNPKPNVGGVVLPPNDYV